MSAHLIPQSLLDDLRNAAEFMACVEQCMESSVDNGSYKDAQDWLRSAGLAVGRSLIEAKAAMDEARHA